MKSSVKTQRKVINLPKKPVVGSSSFKVTNSRLIGGKCRNTNQVFLDSDEEDDESDCLVEAELEQIIELVKNIDFVDPKRNISKDSSDKPNTVNYFHFDLFTKIYEAILTIPTEPNVQHLIKNYLNATLQKLKEPEAVNTMYEKQRTIWITPPSPGFITDDSKVETEQLLHPRVCVWVPHQLLLKKSQDCLICPAKDCDGKLSSEGFTDRYTYRKIIEASDHFYVFTHTYKCSKDENHIFDGCNEKIVGQLHELSQRGYDIHQMGPDYGTSKTLQHIASVYKRNGMSDTDIIAAVKSLHSEKIKFLQKQYTLSLNKS